MSLGEGTLYALIVGCEVAFWVALFSGLAFRYLLRWSRVSSFVLWCVPLIDVALLAFTVLDLRSGTVATFAHGLATAYVGFTVAFGPIMVIWADQRFGYRFGGGPLRLSLRPGAGPVCSMSLSSGLDVFWRYSSSTFCCSPSPLLSISQAGHRRWKSGTGFH